MLVALDAPFQLGPWTVSPASNELTQDGETLRVESKVMALLMVLAQHPLQLVSRDDLLSAVWPDVVVNPDTLSRAVSKLRHALGDDSQNPIYIETIPKRGYRLLVTPEAIAEVPLPPRAQVPEGASADESSWLAQRRVVLLIGLAVVLLGLLGLWTRPELASAPVYSATPLTSSAGVERDPAIGPNGMVVYAARQRDSTSYDLFVRAPAATDAQRLTVSSANDRHPIFAPDGQSIAFLRCTVPLACAVYTMPLLGGVAQRLTDTPVAPYGLAWMPEQDALLVVERDRVEAPYQITRFDMLDQTRVRLSRPPAGSIGDLYPRLRPDGSQVAFVRHTNEGTEDVFVLDLETGQERQLTTFRTQIAGVAWDMTGTHVLLTTRTGERAGLWKVDVSSGKIEQQTAPSRALGNLTVTAKGILAEVWSQETNIWRLDASASPSQAAQPAIVSTAVDHQPALSPDGQRMAFVSTRSGDVALWVARHDGTQALRLVGGGGYIGAPHWSPDGETLVFEWQNNDQADIYRIHAEGGTPRALTSDVAYDLAPRWTPDGNWVVLGSDRSGDWNIWKVRADGDSLHQVTTTGGFAAAEHADGTLYFTRYLEDGLWALASGSRTPTQVLEQPAALDWGNWAVDANGIVFLERHPEANRLMQYTLATRTFTELMRVGLLPSREPALSVTFDGRWVAYAQHERIESDLVWFVEEAR